MEHENVLHLMMASAKQLKTRTGESTDLIFETGLVKNTGAFSYVFGDLKMIFDCKRNRCSTSFTYRRVMACAHWDEAKVLDNAHKIDILF